MAPAPPSTTPVWSVFQAGAPTVISGLAPRAIPPLMAAAMRPSAPITAMIIATMRCGEWRSAAMVRVQRKRMSSKATLVVVRFPFVRFVRSPAAGAMPADTDAGVAGVVSLSGAVPVIGRLRSASRCAPHRAVRQPVRGTGLRGLHRLRLVRRFLPRIRRHG